MRVLGTEYYTLLSRPGGVTTSSRGQGREEDLFCGMRQMRRYPARRDLAS